MHLRHRVVHPRPTPAPTVVALRRRAAVHGRVAGTRRRRSTYALEGAIFVTGAAVQWLRDGLQIVGTAAETEAIAAHRRRPATGSSSCPR